MIFKGDHKRNKNMILLSLLLLAFVHGSAPELPGAILLNVGFDYRNGTIDYMTTSKALPIFQYSYDKGKTFSPPTHPKIVWSVPDDVYVLSKPSSFFSSYSGESWSFSFVQKTSLTSWHIGGGFSYDGFGINANYSTEIGKLHAWCKFKLYDIFLSDILYIIYYAEPVSYLFMTISPMFQAFIDHMPRQIKTEMDKKIVKEFILKYGTHFSEDGYFGGKFHFDSHLKIKYVNSTTIEFCSKQFSLNFFYSTWDLTLGGGFFKNKSQIHIDQKYLKQAVSEYFFEGGDLQYQSNATLKEWRNSLYDTQAMTNGTLTPLWELFDDPQKEAVVKQAISNYIKNGKPFGGALTRIDHPSYALSSGMDHTSMKSQSPVFASNNDYKKVVIEEKKTEEVVKTFTDIPEYEDYQRFKMLVDTSHNNKFLPIHSRELYTFLKKTKEGKRLTICEKTIELFSLEHSNSPLKAFQTPDFDRFVSSLPIVYDQSKYFDFLSGFGTTYVKKVVLGGLFKMNVWVDKDKPVDEEKIRMFCKKVLGEDVVVDDEFLENADVSYVIWGGEGDNDDEYPSWDAFTDSVERNPSPLKYELGGIEELVHDPLKKKFVKMAVEEYQIHTKNKMDKDLLGI